VDKPDRLLLDIITPAMDNMVSVVLCRLPHILRGLHHTAD
jgi:hypothetical protein